VAAVIRHAFAEGLIVLRERAVVSVILALALGVPIALAGVGLALHHWLGPVADLSGQGSSVAVLLHPQMESGERRRWIAELATDHPEWTISEVSSSDLAERLQRWFPYLEDLIDSGDATLPPLVEILTDNPDSVTELEDRVEVLAIGPRSSIQQTLGRVARRLALIVGVVSFVLLVVAVLLAAVWVHLELYRHADEVIIMRLVGATEGTIRGPFLVAVAIPGVVAGILSVVGSLVTVSGLSKLASALGLSAISIPPSVLVLQLAAGVFLPLLAAVVTLARYTADATED
jgi:cell division transport system permease protein